MKKYLLLLFCFLSCCAGELMAQQAVMVSGVVTDEKGTPLENVTVKQTDTRGGTLTDNKGRFTIQLKNPDDAIEFSYVGYLTFKQKADGNTTLHIVLKQDTKNGTLQGVVVVGQQSQTKRNTTTAISSVSGKDIENLPAPSVDALLQGRVAGLNVQISTGEPGVAPTIVVRGNSRLNTNIGSSNVAQAQALSGPLYVIDGIPVNPEDISNNIDATGTNYLAGININDIESVDVQKDAAATAAWGSRGANGVIYIRTRRGRSAKPEFRVNMYGGITTQPTLLQTATGAQEHTDKMNLIKQYATPIQLATLPQLLTDSLNPYFNNATDWQGLFYRQGNVKNVDATMSAASDIVNYRISLNYYDEKGIIEAFGYKRYSVRGNFDFKINSKLNSQFIVALSKGDRQRGMKYYDNSDENTPVSGSSMPSSFYNLTAFDSSNFTGIYSKLRNKNINDNYISSLTVNYAILPFLKYIFQGSANISTSNRDYFQPSNVDAVAALDPEANAQRSFAESDRGTYSTYFISNNLNFVKQFSAGNGHAHNVAVTLAQQYTSDVSSGSVLSGYNTPTNDIQVVDGIPQSDLSGYSYYNKDALLSFMGQAQYDFDKKYLLYASYRGDASSRFGNNTKWGYFPAAGAGWIISDEKFMSSTKKVLSFLKLRGSYGISGSQSPNFYAPYNSYIVPGTYGGQQAIQPSYTNGLTKNNLTWAKTEQKNIGVDAQFFDGRVSITADVYDKISKDDYYDFALPFYTGYESINFNAKDLWVSNRGTDLTIATHNLSPKSKLQWNSQLTLSFNKNAIAKLPNNNRTFTITDSYGVTRLFAVGQPIYEMFQMQYGGVYNNASEIPFDPLTGKPITYFKGNHPVVPGDPIWKDVNHIGDVWSDEDNGNQYGDLTASGNPNPKFTGGFINDFTYKNFSLSIISVFTWKRTVINTFFQQQLDAISGNDANNFATHRLPDLDGIDYWTPAKAAAKADYKASFPAINPFSGYYYQFLPFSTMFNEDGSYLKIKNVVLTYQLPHSIYSRLGITNARVYGIAENVLTIKNSDMPDPEAVDELGVYTGGSYPQPLKFTVGIDIQF